MKQALLLPHFTDEETKAQGSRSWPKITQQGSNGTGFEPRPTPCRMCVLDVSEWTGVNRRVVKDLFPGNMEG